MTVVRKYELNCNGAALGCTTVYQAPEAGNTGRSPTTLRITAARTGWSYVPSVHGRAHDKDFCPDHQDAAEAARVYAQSRTPETPPAPPQASQPQWCPDGGTCHHFCAAACFRVLCCGPLSNVYPGDVWPARLTATHQGLATSEPDPGQ